MTVGIPVPPCVEVSATKIELKSKSHWLYDTLTTAAWVCLRVTGKGEAGHYQHS